MNEGIVAFVEQSQCILILFHLVFNSSSHSCEPRSPLQAGGTWGISSHRKRPSPDQGKNLILSAILKNTKKLKPNHPQTQKLSPRTFQRKQDPVKRAGSQSAIYFAFASLWPKKPIFVLIGQRSKCNNFDPRLSLLISPLTTRRARDRDFKRKGKVHEIILSIIPGHFW